MNDKPLVIYIMADNRSGSTLLENILSKSPQAFSVGELAMLRGHILKEGYGERWNWNCSCGKPFTQCEFWSPIIEKTYTKNPENFFTKINWNFKSKVLTMNAVFPSLFRERLSKICNADKNKKVIPTISEIYNLVAEHTGKNIIIDSSKNPLQALAIYKNQTNFNVKIIWLKRDIRAIATSKRKWKEQNKRKQKSLFKLNLDIFYYRRLCYTVSKMVNQDDIITIDYKSLATQTDKELKRIFSAFNLQPFETPEFMELQEDHTIAGTPGRFSKKAIQYDENWKQQFNNNKTAYFAGGILNKL